MSTSLTPNALELLFNEAEVKEPVLQVMKYRKFENGRYRVQLSDGIHFTTSAMFSAGPNEMIENEEIDTHSLIKIHRFMLNKINEAKSILIIIETSVVSKGDGIGQIGDPTSYEGRATSAAGNNGNASSVSQVDALKNICDRYKKNMDGMFKSSGRISLEAIKQFEEALEMLTLVKSSQEDASEDEMEEDNSVEVNHGQVNIKQEIKTEPGESDESRPALHSDNENTEQPSKKRKIDTDKLEELLQKNLKRRMMGLVESFQKEKEEDQINLFFKSMALATKKLSPEKQVNAKLRISQLIGELELETISNEGAARNASA